MPALQPVTVSNVLTQLNCYLRSNWSFFVFIYQSVRPASRNGKPSVANALPRARLVPAPLGIQNWPARKQSVVDCQQATGEQSKVFSVRTIDRAPIGQLQQQRQHVLQRKKNNCAKSYRSKKRKTQQTDSPNIFGIIETPSTYILTLLFVTHQSYII